MLQLNQVSLRRGDRLLFTNASLQAHFGQRLGVTGANGSGKSSLFDAILGRLEVDEGAILLDPEYRIAHVGQESPASKQPALDFVLDGDIELRALQACHAEIRTRGATLVAITPQLPEHTATSLDEMDISFPILNDCGNEVARRFGLTFTVDEELRPIYSKSFKIDLPKENGDQSYELPIPSTFVVAQDGRVCTAFNDPNYFRRLEPRAILEALDEL